MTRTIAKFPRKIVYIIFKQQMLAKLRKKREDLVKIWINTHLKKREIQSYIKKLYELEGEDSFLQSCHRVICAAAEQYEIFTKFYT